MGFLTHCRHVLCIVLLGVLIWLVVAALALVRTLEVTAAGLPDRLEQIVERHTVALRGDFTAESAAWRRTVEAQAAAARDAVVVESEQWRNQTLTEIAEARRDTLVLLDRRTGELLAKADVPTAAAIALLDEYRRIPAMVGARLDPWTDCKGNGACWQAQWTALLGASRTTAGETSRTLRTIREATPGIVANVNQTTANVARITRPDSLAIKILKIAAPIGGGALFGAMK
jgi:hypothetical protein